MLFFSDVFRDQIIMENLTQVYMSTTNRNFQIHFVITQKWSNLIEEKIAANYCSVFSNIILTFMKMTMDPRKIYIFTDAYKIENKIFFVNLFWFNFFPFCFRYEGLTGFYKGFIPNLLRVTPACCITFLVYETMIAAFERQKMLGTSTELEE